MSKSALASCSDNNPSIQYDSLLKVYPPFFGGQFSAHSLFHHGSENG
jgi:hypothetical protein